MEVTSNSIGVLLTPSSCKSKGPPIGLIVGVIVAAVVLVILAIALLLWLRHKRLGRALWVEDGNPKRTSSSIQLRQR